MTTRREFLRGTATLCTVAGGLSLGAAGRSDAQPLLSPQLLPQSLPSGPDPFVPDRLCLNLGTILGYDLSLEDELSAAASAGFRAVEIWMMRLEKYFAEGKTLLDLQKRLGDLGLHVVGGIGFAEWLSPDESKRLAGLETMRREMDQLAALGAEYTAAPAAGPWHERIEPMGEVAARYLPVMELGDATGVRPLLELWGTSPTFSNLADLVSVAIQTGRGDAGLLLDVFHLFRGGNNFDSLSLLAGSAIEIFHLNDYPDAPREMLSDRDRVFPGDGVAPLRSILRRLRTNGFSGWFSLELFNPVYREAYTVAEQLKIGREKTLAVLADA